MGGHRVLDCARRRVVDDLSVADRNGRKAAGRLSCPPTPRCCRRHDRSPRRSTSPAPRTKTFCWSILTDDNGLNPSDLTTYRTLADNLRPDTRDIVMLQDFIHTPALRDAMTSKDHKAWYLPMVLSGWVGTPELHAAYGRVADIVKQAESGREPDVARRRWRSRRRALWCWGAAVSTAGLRSRGRSLRLVLPAVAVPWRGGCFLGRRLGLSLWCLLRYVLNTPRRRGWLLRGRLAPLAEEAAAVLPAPAAASSAGSPRREPFRRARRVSAPETPPRRCAYAVTRYAGPPDGVER